MSKRLIDSDGHFHTIAHYDEQNDRLTVQDCMDAEPILENNHRLATDGDGYNADRSMRRIASIPLTLYTDLMRQGIVSFNGKVTDPVALRKVLNNPDLKKLRTSPGAV